MSNFLNTRTDILNYFKKRNVDKEFKVYLNYHATRYQYLLTEVEKIIKPKKKKSYKILDIGNSYQTELIRNNYPEITVNTLGFYDPRFKTGPKDKHFAFDLNNSQFKKDWIKPKQLHDLIIMAEVIEHLYTNPNLVLNFLLTLLKKDGYLLIQTPNASALNRRLKLILGKNPYDLIRVNRKNPGHFREYTVKELVAIGKHSGLLITKYDISNYFTGHTKEHKIYNSISPLLPENLKEGITIVFQKRK